MQVAEVTVRCLRDLDAIDAAASLSALKTAVSGIQNLPTRDLLQLRTAIRNKIGV